MSRVNVDAELQKDHIMRGLVTQLLCRVCVCVPIIPGSPVLALGMRVTPEQRTWSSAAPVAG